MRGEGHRVDEGLPRLARGRLSSRVVLESPRRSHAEGEHRPRTERQVPARTLGVRMIVEPCPGHEGHPRVGPEPLRDDSRVGEVRIHALRQRLDSLQQREGGLRVERRADVTQLFAAKLGEEAVLAEVVPPLDAPIGGHRLGHRGEGAVAPVERAGLDHDTAESGAVTTEELRDRVDDDVGAVLDGAQEVRRRQRRVDDERHTRVVRDLRESGDVGDLPTGIPDRLGVDDLRLRPDRGGVVGGIR